MTDCLTDALHRDDSATGSPVITPPFHHPAEWAAHACTWLAWPPDSRDWGVKYEAVLWTFVEIIRKLSPFEKVKLLVPSERAWQNVRERLVWAEAPLDCIEMIRCPLDRCWLRDIGPIFGFDAEMRKVVLHFRFTAWGKYRRYRRDAQAPEFVARLLSLPIVKPQWRGRRIVIEGGAFDVNGAGTALATEQCLLDPAVQPRNPGWNRADYEQAFTKWLGIRKIIWLRRGIAGDDDTHGHVDDVCRCIGRRTVVLAEERSPSDPNYAILAENRERLQEATTADGERLEIVPLPMPSPLSFRGRRLPATYTNFYVANGVVLVPTFNDPADRAALGRLAEVFPGRTVIGIHCADLVVGMGALHCLTHEEPAGEAASA